jgi:elongation factor Ts
MNIEMIRSLRTLTSAAMQDCKGALMEADWNLDRAVDLIKIRGKAIAKQKDGRTTKEGKIKIICSEDKGTTCMVEVLCETDFTAKSPEFNSFCDIVAARNIEDDGSSPSLEEMRENLSSATKENVMIRRAVEMKPSRTYGDSIFHYLHPNGQIGVVCRFLSTKPTEKIQSTMEAVVCQIAAMNPICLDEAHMNPEVWDRQMEILNQQVKEMNKPDLQSSKILEGKVKKWLSEVTLLNQESIQFPKRTIQQICSDNSVEVTEFFRFEVGEGIEKKEADFAKDVMGML